MVSMAGGEIVPAGERGAIDAAEWCCPAEDIKLGFHQIWKYYYMPSMHEMTEAGDLIINKKVWDKLAPSSRSSSRSRRPRSCAGGSST